MATVWNGRTQNGLLHAGGLHASVRAVRGARQARRVLGAGAFKALAYALAALACAAAIGLVVLYQPRLAVISSASMLPTMAQGDIALSVRSDPGEIAVGDVLVFQKVVPFTKVQIVAHRVVEVVEGEQGYVFRTKGDANDDMDPWDSTSSDVIGRVIAVVPGAGRPLLFLQRHLIAITVAVVGIGLIFLYAGTDVGGGADRRRSYISQSVWD
jgi:signal peptidase I